MSYKCVIREFVATNDVGKRFDYCIKFENGKKTDDVSFKKSIIDLNEHRLLSHA